MASGDLNRTLETMKLRALVVGTARGLMHNFDFLGPEFPTMFEAVVEQESKFNPRATSGEAWGLSQLRPAAVTDAARFLGDTRPNESVPMDPIRNARYGAAYLAMNYQRFSGDWRAALAAYNAGPTVVANQGAEEIIQSYPETRAYVTRIMGRPAVQKALSDASSLDSTNPNFVGPLPDEVSNLSPPITPAASSPAEAPSKLKAPTETDKLFRTTPEPEATPPLFTGPPQPPQGPVLPGTQPIEVGEQIQLTPYERFVLSESQRQGAPQ